MLDPAARPPRRLLELTESGKLGKKTDGGFYTWVGGRAQKSAAGTVPAGLADRLIGPFVAEAKAALADRIVADADLVDAGAVFGTGFAPFRGGPLHYAASLSRAER
jgi:3-hydroxyacyl-CoA dehydrogenase/enoyl-CoA hydratase/3-hydroxybutyryl-CoA epimerase